MFILTNTILTFASLALKANKIGWDGLDTDVEDTTWFGSPEFFKEQMPGLIDAGEVTIGTKWHPSLAIPSRVIAPFVLTWPDGTDNAPGTAWGASAFLKKLAIKIEKGKPATADWTLKLTGVPNFDATPGTAQPTINYSEFTLAGLLFGFTPTGVGATTFSQLLTGFEFTIEWDVEEVTSDQSGRLKEFFPGLRSWSAKTDGYFDPAIVPPLGTQGELVVAFPSDPAVTWGGQAIFKSPKPDGEAGKVAKQSIEFAYAGALNFSHS